MKPKGMRLLIALLSIALLALPLVSSADKPGGMKDLAENFPPADSKGGVNESNTSSLRAPAWVAATRPWTGEELLAARPYPMPEVKGAALRTALSEEKSGEAGLIPAIFPAGEKPEEEIILHFAEDGEALSANSPLGYSYPAPFARFNNFHSYTMFPYVTVGKLFFRQYGYSYQCSAASIGNYGVWTAGHCVHAGDGSDNGWSYDVVFIPAYRNGNAPYGQWPAAYLWVTTAWHDYEDLRYDMGGGVLNTNGSGQKISQVVGALGFAWNMSKQKLWFDMGYPAAYPFTGNYQVICAASFAYNDKSLGSPYPTGIGCDMTGGCSGGPWILAFGSGNYLNGQNSYRYTDHPKELFSPYYGDAAKSLYDCVVNSTPSVARCTP